MQKWLIALVVLLTVAVGVLYYKVFSTPKSKNTPIAATNGTVKSGSFPVAYVNLDSLNEHITFIKDNRKKIEAEQAAMEREWENGYKNLEAQKNNFLKKGNSITQQEAEEFQGRLIQQQQQIDAKKQTTTQQLTEKSYKLMQEIQKDLESYLQEYNSDKRYEYILSTGAGADVLLYKDSLLNITNDVIEGMNKKMDSKK